MFKTAFVFGTFLALATTVSGCAELNKDLKALESAEGGGKGGKPPRPR